ncbi:fam-j protein [Plasmodium relictum]|uniref:Fam-j protein n=1 Tax=Plasmodium relictum TaxID=85471 RepID=A0A1J1GNW4_PLARL|nr:fam-j protein [Plasmodium relictum]CRG84729.1 fam-j protein [Plasmodium relictum]
MINSNRKCYIYFFFYSLQYFILISICISQELQGRNPDLSLEKISSNVYITENSPNTGNLIDAVDIEQDETLSLESICIHFPVEEKNSDSDNKNDFFMMNLVDTINLEKSELCNINNAIYEAQIALLDPLTEPLFSSFENENSIIHTETKFSNVSLMCAENVEHEDSIDIKNTLDEASNTLPDSLEESTYLPSEHKNLTIYTEEESSSISLIGTKDADHEESVEIQKILNELLSTLPDSQVQPVDLPLKPENSTVHTGTEPSNIGLIGTKIIEHENSCNISSIFSDPHVTSNYSERGSLDLPLGEHNLSFYIGEGSSNVGKLMHVAYEKPIELENTLPSFSINHDDQEDTRLVDIIEQTLEKCMGNEKNEEKIDEQIRGENIVSEQNFDDSFVINYSMEISIGNTRSRKKRGKKRNYEDIDNLDNQDTGNYVCINPKKKKIKNGENLFYSLLNILDIEIKLISRHVVPNLQKLRDILNDDNKNTHSELEEKLKINILSLRHIISKELQKINHSDLRVIKSYYDKNIEKNTLLKSINKYILSFRSTINHRFDKKKEIHERVELFLKILHDLISEHKFMHDLYYTKSIIINNSMHSKLLSSSSIDSLETLRHIFKLFEFMDKLIKIVEKSIKNGLLFRDHNYFCYVQKIIYNLYTPINANIRRHLVKLGEILNALNLSFENYSIIMQAIFFFLREENVKNKEKLRYDINELYGKNSFRAIYDFLLEEESCISWFHSEVFEIFNVNLNEKNKEGMSFDDLISNENSANHLSSLYEVLMKLIGALFIKKQLTIISKIRISLLNMNSLKKGEYILHKKKKIIKKEHKSNLLSQIEVEKCKMEIVKFKIKNLYLFVSIKKNIGDIQVSNDLKNKMKEIGSILRFLSVVTYENEDKTKFNQKKKDNMGSILLSLYYAYQILITFTENEIQ